MSCLEVRRELNPQKIEQRWWSVSSPLLEQRPLQWVIERRAEFEFQLKECSNIRNSKDPSRSGSCWQMNSDRRRGAPKRRAFHANLMRRNEMRMKNEAKKWRRKMKRAGWKLETETIVEAGLSASDFIEEYTKNKRPTTHPRVELFEPGRVSRRWRWSHPLSILPFMSKLLGNSTPVMTKVYRFSKEGIWNLGNRRKSIQKTRMFPHECMLFVWSWFIENGK